MRFPTHSSGEKTRRFSPSSALTLAIFIAVALAGSVVLLVLLTGLLGSTEQGGLATGKLLPKIEAEGWVNGPLPDLTGKVVVVDAWATWCLPCLIEAPHLVKTYRRFSERGDVVFVGLTVEPSGMLPEIETFLRETGIEWPNGYGAVETLMHLRAEYIPAVWVANKEGVIVWNSDSSGDLEGAIEQALR